MSLFEDVVRGKVRFSSSRGELTVEQLWDVPLRSGNDFNLNEIARAAKRRVDQDKEENFVDNNPSESEKLDRLRFAAIEHVIKTLLLEDKKRLAQKLRREERQKLLSILSSKKDEALSGLSVEELEQRLAELSC